MTLTSFGVRGWNCHMGDGVALAHLLLSSCSKPRLLPHFDGGEKAYDKGACDPMDERSRAQECRKCNVKITNAENDFCLKALPFIGKETRSQPLN